MKYYILLLGKQVPLYGLCFYLGVALAALIGACVTKKTKRLPMYDFVYSAVYCMIGAVIGAKILFIAVSLKEIISLGIPLVSLIKGGFVFYGGLIGGFIGIFIYSRIYKVSISSLVDIYACALPFGHAVGRIGCYFAGCCYGMRYNGIFSVTYHESAGLTPLNISLFPVQLAEAVCLFILGIVMTVLVIKIKMPCFAGIVYIMSYSSIRFMLEFLRGDRERGIIVGLSTSQWVSVFILSFGLGALMGIISKELQPRH